VIRQEALAPELAAESEETAAPVSRWTPTVVALVVVAALAAAFLIGFNLHRSPGDDSVEAGFARDMVVHHDQAVAMALLIRDRTADPLVKTLATDIVLTQQNQVGQMLGWLNVWGLPATGKELPMSWMGHPTSGLMPGMASPDEMTALAAMSGEAADVEFLRLMILHHQGGIAMAEAALQRSGNEQVRDLAGATVAAQQAEIATMESLLAAKTGSAGSA
jgi:uncharacterized protein (DUF305 family)